jgi:diguanylate cyclase (GGDEF)-like protein
MDIDHFKHVNDEWGHAMGDEVLRQVGRLLRQHTRERVDLPARYGGEEFVVLLPDTTLEGAQAVAEKLAVRLREQDFMAKGRSFRVTMSLGVVQYGGGDPDLALREADRNLYEAKAQGRDRIVATLAPTGATMA